MSKANQALTRVETQALEVIESFINKNGYAPSIRELAHAMKYNSSSTAFNVVERLRKKGAISTERNGPRTIRMLKPHAPAEGDCNEEVTRLREENAMLVHQLVVIAEVATEETIKGAARQTLRDIGVDVDK